MTMTSVMPEIRNSDDGEPKLHSKIYISIVNGKMRRKKAKRG